MDCVIVGGWGRYGFGVMEVIYLNNKQLELPKPCTTSILDRYSSTPQRIQLNFMTF
jgi:hypothetical protein